MAGKKQTEEQVARFADMFSALGTEPRLRIMRLLLSAHPGGHYQRAWDYRIYALASSGQTQE